jgi:DNA polymerase
MTVNYSKLKLIELEIRGCNLCDLYKTKREYVPGIIGDAYPNTVFVGEAPGRWEDLNGEPFGGRSGKLLMEAIFEVFGMKRGEYTILNTLKCRPPDNRDPKLKEQKKCQRYLYGQIKALSPCTIIPLGKYAGNMFSPQQMSATELTQSYFVDKTNGVVVIPCFHPAYILRNKKMTNAFMNMLRSIRNGDYEDTRTRYRRSVIPSAPKGLDGRSIILPQ